MTEMQKRFVDFSESRANLSNVQTALILSPPWSWAIKIVGMMKDKESFRTKVGRCVMIKNTKGIIQNC